MSEMSQFVATFCCGVFFGAAVYVSLVQHPAALETGIDFAAQFFAPMYRRAAWLQASLAVIGAAAGIIAWWKRADSLWLAGAVLLFSAVPFTLVIIKPVNDALIAGQAGDERGALLARWGRLHWVRTAASALAFIVCVAALLRRAP